MQLISERHGFILGISTGFKNAFSIPILFYRKIKFSIFRAMPHIGSRIDVPSASLVDCRTILKQKYNMATPVSVTKLQSKSHDSPDEVRTPNRTRVEVNNFEGFTIGRFNFEPGWRWSECIKPVVKTDHCQLSHVGYAISGQITIRMQDGTQKTIGPGESYTIPPGHEAWVEGDQPFVGIEVMSADVYAKP